MKRFYASKPPSLEEDGYDLDKNGELRVYYAAGQESRATIKRYID